MVSMLNVAFYVVVAIIVYLVSYWVWKNAKKKKPDVQVVNAQVVDKAEGDKPN